MGHHGSQRHIYTYICYNGKEFSSGICHHPKEVGTEQGDLAVHVEALGLHLHRDQSLRELPDRFLQVSEVHQAATEGVEAQVVAGLDGVARALATVHHPHQSSLALLGEIHSKDGGHNFIHHPQGTEVLESEGVCSLEPVQPVLHLGAVRLHEDVVEALAKSLRVFNVSRGIWVVDEGGQIQLEVDLWGREERL